MPHTAKQCFSVVLKHFRGNSQRTSLFSPKSDYLRKNTELLRKFVLLNIFEKGQILRKIWICFKNLFDQTSKMEKIFLKNCFSPQCEPHTDKLCFSVVLKHFWGNSQKKSLFVQKSDFLRKNIENLRNLLNLIFLKRVNPEENLDLYKQLFLIKPVKGDNIKKKKFLLKLSHLELNYAFLLFWSILGEIQREVLFLVKKGAI